MVVMRYAITPATPDELDPLAPLWVTLGHARGPWNRASYYFRIRTVSAYGAQIHTVT